MRVTVPMIKAAFHIFHIALLSIVLIVTLDKCAVNALLTPGHLCKTDTQSWSLPFFTPFIC